MVFDYRSIGSRMSRTVAIEPLSPARCKVQFTASAELRDKLERPRDLMRSSIPDGDLAAIIDAALEFHHRRPLALGGDHSPANVSVLCKAHNTYLAQVDFGRKAIGKLWHRSTAAASTGELSRKLRAATIEGVVGRA